jgi:hypothetical protein
MGLPPSEVGAVNATDTEVEDNMVTAPIVTGPGAAAPPTNIPKKPDILRQP